MVSSTKPAMPVHIVLILIYRFKSGRTDINPASSKPIAAIPTHFEAFIVPTSVYLPSSIGGVPLRIGVLGAQRGPNVYFCWHANGQNQSPARRREMRGTRASAP